MFKRTLMAMIVGSSILATGCSSSGPVVPGDTPASRPEGDRTIGNGFSPAALDDEGMLLYWMGQHPLSVLEHPENEDAEYDLARQVLSEISTGGALSRAAYMSTSPTIQVQDRKDAMRQMLQEIVSCALGPEQQINIPNGEETITFTGQIGLATGWYNDPIQTDAAAGEGVSECLAARLNAVGVRVPILLTGDLFTSTEASTTVTSYTVDEITVFGNYFADDSAPVYVCAEAPVVNACGEADISEWLQYRVCGAQACSSGVVLLGKCSDVCTGVPGARVCTVDTASGAVTYEHPLTVRLARTGVAWMYPSTCDLTTLDNASLQSSFCSDADGQALCQACTANNGCDQGFVCDSADTSQGAFGTCKPGCSTDNDCGDGALCNGGLCDLLTCQGQADCTAAGAVCNYSTNLCMRGGCTSNYDCDGAYYYCWIPAESSGGGICSDTPNGPPGSGSEW